MISLPCDGQDLDARRQRSFGCRITLEEQIPELSPAVCDGGQLSLGEGRREDGGSCAEPGSSLPPAGSWRDTEDHASPAANATCGRSTLAVCSGSRNSRPLIPLVELICSSLWPPPFCVPTTCPPARGLCCHCWLLVPLAPAYCICFDLPGLAFSHPFSVYCGFLSVSSGWSSAAPFSQAVHQLHINCSPVSAPSLPPRLAAWRLWFANFVGTLCDQSPALPWVKVWGGLGHLSQGGWGLHQRQSWPLSCKSVLGKTSSDCSVHLLATGHSSPLATARCFVQSNFSTLSCAALALSLADQCHAKKIPTST